MSIAQLSGGASIWYQRSGVGKAVLHIHGSAFGHANFAKLTPHMISFAEIIDFDLPGYGESRDPAQRKDMPALADLVAEFIAALGFPKLNIHGTSFGAMIALTLAARHPSLVDKLILSCCLARYDNAARLMRATWKRAAIDSGMEAVADLTSVAGFGRGYYERAEAQAQLAAMRTAFARTQPAAFVAGTEIIERTDLSDLVRDVQAQTLLLAGEEDNMTPFRPAASGVGFTQIEKMLRHCETEVLKDCGHYLVIEQPAAAALRIQRFLA
jgi:pimeloyl-ACP methyl ester carboxylesterase